MSIKYYEAEEVDEQLDNEFIDKVINWDKSTTQSRSNEEDFERTPSTLELRGNIYGLSNEHVTLILDDIPDSIKIDTLSASSSLIVTKDGESYLKIDSASTYSFFVEIDHEYELKYTHPDYVSKIIVVDATTVPEFGEDLVMDISMSMFSPNVATELDEPLCTISYNKVILNMDWDVELFEKQVSKMLKVE